MSFETALKEVLGSGTDAHDIRAAVKRCWFYDLDGFPIRLWDGQGTLYTEDGNVWLGTVDGAGTQHHRAPALQDPRDGASPEYRFSLPFLDTDTFNALKDDETKVVGKNLYAYWVLFRDTDGLRPLCPLRLNQKITLTGVTFDRSMRKTADGLFTHVNKATAFGRSSESGRSRVPGGTYTDTAQRSRAAFLGVAQDSGCSFVAGNARRTYVINPV